MITLAWDRSLTQFPEASDDFLVDSAFDNIGFTSAQAENQAPSMEWLR